MQSSRRLPASDSNTPSFEVLRSAKDMALENFGHVEGLMLVEASKVELAEHYAKARGLRFKDPDVCATATLKAWTRFREFSLIQASERRVYEEAVRSGEDYGDALYRITQSDAQKRVIQEIRRLHDQCRRLDKDLEALEKLEKGGPS